MAIQSRSNLSVIHTHSLTTACDGEPAYHVLAFNRLSDGTGGPFLARKAELALGVDFAGS